MTLAPTPSRITTETQVSQPSPGVTLLFRPTDANEIVAVEMVLPMGSREEPARSAGIGPLALRMLMRGTRHKSDYEIAVGFESLGAAFSMDVHKDRAVLSVQTTLSQFQPTMELVEEILTEPTFPEEFFEIEKEILKKEILEDLDSPYFAAVRLFQATLFGGHPYAQPNTGTLETVSALTRDATLAYFEENLRRGPVSIGIVGNLDTGKIEKALGGVFEYLGKDPQPSSSEPLPLDRETASTNEAYEIRSIDSECMVYGFCVPGIHDADYARLKVIDAIRGGSMDSRLFTEVREKQGLVYQIGSSFPGLEWGSYFAISLITTVANHGKVLETLDREIERIRTDPPDEGEVERAKTYLQGTFLMSQEKNSDQALMLARYHSLGLGIEYIDRYPKFISEVSPESLHPVAQDHFQGATLAIVGPGPTPETV